MTCCGALSTDSCISVSLSSSLTSSVDADLLEGGLESVEPVDAELEELCRPWVVWRKLPLRFESSSAVVLELETLAPWLENGMMDGGAGPDSVTLWPRRAAVS